MPRLLARRAESVVECVALFRAAAIQRCHEAAALNQAGRRSSAVYLWGYSTEMLLKAAAFAVSGYAIDAPITKRDLNQMVSLGRQYGLTGRNLHDLDFWGRMLVRHRTAIGQTYTDPAFSAEVEMRATQVDERWREILRYRTNIAYQHEVATVAENAEWFVTRIHQL